MGLKASEDRWEVEALHCGHTDFQAKQGRCNLRYVDNDEAAVGLDEA